MGKPTLLQRRRRRRVFRKIGVEDEEWRLKTDING